MDKKVKRVMDFIHGVAYNEVDINRYVDVFGAYRV